MTETTGREDLIQVLYGKAATWARKNIILEKGEHGYEWDTNCFKIGDGDTHYNDLDYYLPESQIRDLIAAAIAELPAGGGIAQATLDAHINSTHPHPAYDNVSSLVTRYRNRKV